MDKTVLDCLSVNVVFDNLIFKKNTSVEGLILPFHQPDYLI